MYGGDILILIYLAYKTGMRAKRKGQNILMWVTIMIAAFFMGYMLGLMVILSFFYEGKMDPVSLVNFLEQRFSLVIFMILCGVGGYLLVRYILERFPDKKDPGLS